METNDRVFTSPWTPADFATYCACIAGDSTGVELNGLPGKLLKRIVGTIRIETMTSSVSSSLGYVLSTSYRSLGTAKQRPKTPKPKIQQVILQAMDFRRPVRIGGSFLISDNPENW